MYSLAILHTVNISELYIKHHMWIMRNPAACQNHKDPVSVLINMAFPRLLCLGLCCFIGHNLLVHNSAQLGSNLPVLRLYHQAPEYLGEEIDRLIILYHSDKTCWVHIPTMTPALSVGSRLFGQAQVAEPWVTLAASPAPTFTKPNKHDRRSLNIRGGWDSVNVL